mgnify:CR=1 FL=1
MESMSIADLPSGRRAYRLFGDPSSPCVVIETALAASCAEWWHLAERWSKEFRVLVHDRAGYGASGKPQRPRSPEHVAEELLELLDHLGIARATLLGHSLGGLFAFVFSRRFPERASALVLVDPVSFEEPRFKRELSKDEYRRSGIDKGFNLKIGLYLCSAGLGGLLRPLLKKSPPFHYYDGFSKEAERRILENATSRRMYGAAIGEYAFIKDDRAMRALGEMPGNPSIPLYLICHTPEVMEKEIAYYGNAPLEAAARIEALWRDVMSAYLKTSTDSCLIQARNSGHSIHLTDPETILDAIRASVGHHGK